MLGQHPRVGLTFVLNRHPRVGSTTMLD